MQPSFTLTEEQTALRDTARRFLRDKSGTDKVREDMATASGFDESLWKEIAQMGWQAMAIPEEHGGAGYGVVEQAILLEEMGRFLFCAPYLSSVVLGATAVLSAATDDQKAELLPAVAAGELRLTVAGPLGPDVDSSPVRVEGGALHGEVDTVIDGHTADRFVVLASGEDGLELHLTAADADGIETEQVTSLDQTRKLARVRFDGTAAERLGDAEAGSAWRAAIRAGAVALANEQVGGAQQVLDMAVDYAKTRKQFGRAIGSFQAIKHRCAELLVDVESAKSTAYHAARALAADEPDEQDIAIPLARSYCSEVYERAAAENIQIHGGIGFTWEHDAHLYFKRAKSTKLLLGDPVGWRADLADALGF